MSVSSLSVLPSKRYSSALKEVPAPGQSNLAGSGNDKRRERDLRSSGDQSVDREPRYERNADARRHHLHQRVQAARFELRPCLPVTHSTYVERVTAQTMAFLQQHESFAFKRGRRHFVDTGERMAPIAGEQELVLHDDFDGEIPGVIRQREQGDVQFSVLQTGE